MLALHALAPIAASLGLDDAAARMAVGELVRHSLADPVRMPTETIDETEPAWLLAHALLPEWGKKRLGEFGVGKEECFARWKGFWFSFLNRCHASSGVPGGPTRYAALAEHLDALLDGIEQQSGGESQTLCAVLSNVGSLHRDMGRYAAAEACYRSDLAISEKTLGPEHPIRSKASTTLPFSSTTEAILMGRSRCIGARWRRGNARSARSIPIRSRAHSTSLFCSNSEAT